MSYLVLKMEEEKQEAIKKEKMGIALKLLADGKYDIAQIQNITELSDEDLKKVLDAKREKDAKLKKDAKRKKVAKK
jgi:CRISPR/Cas system CSM-associated protein Csm2 small subunit